MIFFFNGDPFVFTDEMLAGVQDQSCENESEGTECFFDNFSCVKRVDIKEGWCIYDTYASYLAELYTAFGWNVEIYEGVNASLREKNTEDYGVKLGVSIASAAVLAGIF